MESKIVIFACNEFQKKYSLSYFLNSLPDGEVFYLIYSDKKMTNIESYHVHQGKWSKEIIIEDQGFFRFKFKEKVKTILGEFKCQVYCPHFYNIVCQYILRKLKVDSVNCYYEGMAAYTGGIVRTSFEQLVKRNIVSLFVFGFLANSEKRIFSYFPVNKFVAPKPELISVSSSIGEKISFKLPSSLANGKESNVVIAVGTYIMSSISESDAMNLKILEYMCDNYPKSKKIFKSHPAYKYENLRFDDVEFVHEGTSEDLIIELSPSVLISSFSSTLMNADLGPEVEIYVFVNDKRQSDFLVSNNFDTNNIVFYKELG